jgi:hypothetical protein
MNHAIKAIAHETTIRRVAYSYSAAEHRSRGALWPSFAPALIFGKHRPNLLAHQPIVAQDMWASRMFYSTVMRD